MAIITVMALALAIIIPTAIAEWVMALHRRVREARTWRNLKKIYYPDRLVAARRDA